jgi:hypothetical protein
MVMNRLLLCLIALTGLVMACSRPVYVVNPAPRHDNGLHKGWYKHGAVKGMPPGQAKKMGRYGIPPGQAKKMGRY